MWTKGKLCTHPLQCDRSFGVSTNFIMARVVLNKTFIPEEKNTPFGYYPTLWRESRENNYLKSIQVILKSSEPLGFFRSVGQLYNKYHVSALYLSLLVWILPGNSPWFKLFLYDLPLRQPLQEQSIHNFLHKSYVDKRLFWRPPKYDTKCASFLKYYLTKCLSQLASY